MHCSNLVLRPAEHKTGHTGEVLPSQ